MPRAYLALGANLGDPPAQIEAALQALPWRTDGRVLARSGLYRTAPLGPAGQPDYCNAVALIETPLAAEPLLDALQALEQAAGRQRQERWGARCLDIDLLLYDQFDCASPRLRLPHPELSNRRFVLQPLAEIAPGLMLPGVGRIEDRLASLPPWPVQPWT